jgi:hypothetical protein
MWPPSKADRPGGRLAGPPLQCHMSASCGSYFNRHTCIQDKLSYKKQLGSSINRPAHPTCNTHQRVLYSFHFLELGLVVWVLELSLACLGIPESSSEVWYKLLYHFL